jgi:hypothetical protein
MVPPSPLQEVSILMEFPHLVRLHGPAEIRFCRPFDSAVECKLADAEYVPPDVNNIPLPIGSTFWIREKAHAQDFVYNDRRILCCVSPF